ncbi:MULTISPECIES: tetraacyldisaccharide 4'-kinase [Alphaproteobacteria]|uniref:Tetraacyldisaccharide 4'-kinase n=2 Tax=Alphaproteobacteria TaxID=28211 RepID=A0A512HI14_9HYPH|nr:MULTISPECIES: tetraacyldisaccharide 4'-kinase [Alphaproteobacteria]GEO85094.1 tetraacyldisaccharide 4'-kinase [Ciceribacter naphthalenivorans]GLR24572.1 tetraacyldisaccharide 4'-kinase [Ciceribacter naphthalenivorans]GLT07428.1 tetraacyldisaccharide 4'-kinase [Sphingomonas psychrolutea]
MVSEAPPFWWTKPDWRALSLAPISFLYGRIAGYRMGRKRRHSPPVPVICVGNFTVGGAGKTPTALTLARAAKAKGLKPGFLTRGYGGSLDVTTVVDLEHHRSVDVGDEPLLLAREALTVVSRRRVAGAERLVREGADLIIMDDGFQSARLTVDFALLAIDTGRGIGNGHIVPGGPVRAPIAVQMRYLDAILKVGDGNAADRLVRQAARAGKPVMVAKITPRGDAGLAGRRVLAFAGIADPGKFYRTLETIGADVVETRDFPDHYHLGDDEIDDLIGRADRDGLTLTTTAKDMVRLIGGHGRSEELRRRVSVVDVEMAFDDPRAPGLIIDRAIEVCRARRLKKTAP